MYRTIFLSFLIVILMITTFHVQKSTGRKFNFIIPVYIFLFTIVMFQSLLFSQTEYNVERITTKDGLSQDCIRSIYQDRKGFIWICTEFGLNKYDGFNFRKYVKIPGDTFSINNNYVNTIYEDTADNGKILWFGTKGGLNKLDRETERFTSYYISPNNLFTANLNEIYCIYKMDDSTYWAGGKGIRIFNKKSEKFVGAIEYFNGLNVFSIYKDHLGEIWAGTNTGVINFRYDAKSKNEPSFVCYPIEKDYSDNLYTPQFVEDEKGILWIGTQNGLYNFDRKTRQLARPDIKTRNSAGIDTEIIIWSIFKDSDGNIWGATPAGIMKINPRKNSIICYTENARIFKSVNRYILRTISNITVDRTGVIWAGTIYNGIVKLVPKRKIFQHFENIVDDAYSLGNNKVRSFYEDKDSSLWIATIEGYLNKFDRNKKRFLRLWEYSYIYNIAPDPAGNIWYPANYGLVNYNFKDETGTYYFGKRRYISVSLKIYYNAQKNESFRNYLYDRFAYEIEQIVKEGVPHVNYCYVDQSGIIWCTIGEEFQTGSLFQFDPGKKDYIPYEINTDENVSNSIKLVFEDRSGNLWFGTGDKGLIRRVISNKGLGEPHTKFIHYKSVANDPNSISSNIINTICEDKNGFLWISTDFGLNKFNPETEKFTRYGIRDGLASEHITCILEDDSGNFWMSTNQGLSKFNPKTKEFRNYDESYGIQASLYDGYKGRSGYMYFGGMHGFDLFLPEEIQDNPYPPNVVISGFSLFNKPLTYGKFSPLKKSIEQSDEIVLEHDQDVFTIEFVALDFTNPLKNRYAYKMEGVNPDWVYTDASRRFATYTKLDPGEYTFRVKASNNDGIWNQEGTSISIIVLPPWWRTNWAYAFYVLLAASIVTVIWRFQVNRLQLKHRAELEHFQVEKYQEIDQMKSRFFANISHEFRTPLTLILGPVNKLVDRFKDDSVKNELNVMRRNANRLLQLVNQLLDLSKLEAGRMQLRTCEVNIVPLLKGMVLSFVSLAEAKKISLNFNSFVKELHIFIDREKLSKVINNLLSNAIKFTSEGGTVEIDISRNGNNVEIKISDTGIGIPNQKLDKIFDRFYQVDDSHTRKQEGTGIGLSLTKELVELHKGEIFVKSEEGKGTTFTVTLPLGKDHLKPEEIIETIEEAKDDIYIEQNDMLRSSETKDKKIDVDILTKTEKPILLIVEDNSDVRNYIKEYFEFDYKLVEAENGEKGLEKSLSFMPDLIVSDVMMPKMDGFELCGKLKTDERTSHIPVILLTAKASEQDKIGGLETGADDYMMKPFDVRELKVRIKNLIEQRKKLREHFRKEGLFNFQTEKINSTDKKFLQNAVEIINKNISDESFSVQVFADAIAMSRSQLHRKLIALIDESPGDLIRRTRLVKAAKLIEQNFGNISEIALEVGYSNPANFARSFTSHFGVPPSQYQNHKKL